MEFVWFLLTVIGIFVMSMVVLMIIDYGWYHHYRDRYDQDIIAKKLVDEWMGNSVVIHLVYFMLSFFAAANGNWFFWKAYLVAFCWLCVFAVGWRRWHAN